MACARTLKVPTLAAVNLDGLTSTALKMCKNVQLELTNAVPMVHARTLKAPTPAAVPLAGLVNTV
jgi:hypothetical protein